MGIRIRPGVFLVAAVLFAVAVWVPFKESRVSSSRAVDPPGYEGSHEAANLVELPSARDSLAVFEPSDDQPSRQLAPGVENATPDAENSDPGWPENMEGRLWEFFAHLEGIELTSITRIECDETRCEIAFTGVDVSPTKVGIASDVSEALARTFAEIRSMGVGTNEIAPGAREYVIGMTNALDEEAEAVIRERERGPRSMEFSSPDQAARFREALAANGVPVVELSQTTIQLSGEHMETAQRVLCEEFRDQNVWHLCE